MRHIVRLTQYLIEDAFENGMAKQPGTKIPTIYNSKYGMDLQPQLQNDEQDKDDKVKLNQFNDCPDDSDVCDDSSREKKIDDALNRLRAAILGIDNDDAQNKPDDESFEFDDDEDYDEDEEMPQDPNMPNVGSEQNGQPSLDAPPTDNNNPVEETDQPTPRRFVKNAHLVYKRKTTEGLYEELWIYNIGKDSRMKEYDIRREILRGTDIEQRDTESEDGSQYYEIWTAGNAQMLHIVGLPN